MAWDGVDAAAEEDEEDVSAFVDAVWVDGAPTAWGVAPCCKYAGSGGAADACGRSRKNAGSAGSVCSVDTATGR
ncbi:hypothetical protein, partial [Xanthomonas albilineans]|uniref:hypothetical protein n=1 Tax=Xanthomonas albilineans TaxID=29447 RepID=UPI001B8004CF